MTANEIINGNLSKKSLDEYFKYIEPIVKKRLGYCIYIDTQTSDGLSDHLRNKILKGKCDDDIAIEDVEQYMLDDMTYAFCLLNNMMVYDLYKTNLEYDNVDGIMELLLPEERVHFRLLKQSEYKDAIKKCLIP